MTVSVSSDQHGMRAFFSNRLEILLDHLTEVVSVPLPSPFDKEIILVQSKGMERWLTQKLAAKCGICANCSFPFPNAMIGDIFGKLTKKLPDTSLFSPEVMSWRILWLMPRCLEQKGFESIRHYLAREPYGLKAVQLSRKIADVFDQYTLYRPEMVLEWEQGKEMHWQAQLWRMLTDDCDEPHRAFLRNETLQILQTGEADVTQLPTRICLFGIPILPPFHLEILYALAKHIEVNLFLMNPCQQYWGDIVPARQLLREASKARIGGRNPSGSYHEAGNPLLASLGKMGREFVDLLQDTDLWIEQEEYSDPGEDSLLACVQSDILLLRNREVEAGRKTIRTGDDSIQIHCVHGPMREMEVLKDYLLSLFMEIPGLAPQDILVMTPRIESCAACISAVFAPQGDSKKEIPFSIADRSPGSESLVIQAFLKILDLRGSRFGASEVLDLLDSPVVRKKFGLNPDDMKRVQVWIDATRIRWGKDAQDRERFGVPPFSENSWQEGLDRLLLGYALPMEDQQLFSGILPHDDVEGSESRILGSFVDFASSLFAQVRALEEPREPALWDSSLKALLDCFIDVDDDQEREAQIIRSNLSKLTTIAGRAGFTGNLGIEAVRYWLEEQFQGEALRQGFLSGGVTFCEMLPMRSIPFRVIALVGMNSGAFPRQGRPPEFDLIAQKPQPGDRSLRNEDRYLFLEALLSARERLYISYQGQSIKDNSEIPPSPVVSELMDYIDQGFAPSPPYKTVADQLIIRHRLQAFSPAYFQSNGRLFSYSEENLRALQCRAGGTRQASPFLIHPVPAPSDEFKNLDIRELKKFFRHPAEYFLKTRLGIFLDEEEAAPEDREPFALDRLDQYCLQEELATMLQGNKDVEALEAAVKRRGILPPGIAGDILFTQARQEAESYAGTVTRFLVSPRSQPLEINLRIAGFHLTGLINNIWPPYLIHGRCTKIKPRDQLSAWIDLLVASCSRAAGVESAIVIGSDQVFEFSPPPDSFMELEKLLQLYWQGMSAPIPFFSKTSFAYEESLEKKGDPEQARKAARISWSSAAYPSAKGAADEEDHYNALAFRNVDPLTDEFEAIAGIILKPLLQHRKKLEK